MLTKEALEELQKIDRDNLLEDLNNFQGFHIENYISKIVPLPSRPERLLGQNGIHLLQMSLYRSRCLFDGVINSINTNNPLVLAICTRAHFEMTGAVAYFLKKLQNFYSDTLTYEELDETIGRLSLGIKSKGDLTHAPDPINVMSMIDAADNLFMKLSKDKTKIFRNVYDELSEFCHPNSFGLQMAGNVNKIGVVRYRGFDEPFEINKYFISTFLITAAAFKLFYQDTRELLEEKEELPQIIR